MSLSFFKVKDKKGNQVVVTDDNHPIRNTAEVKQYHSTDEQPNNTKAKQEEDVTPTLVKKNIAGDSGSYDFQREGVSRRYP